MRTAASLQGCLLCVDVCIPTRTPIQWGHLHPHEDAGSVGTVMSPGLGAEETWPPLTVVLSASSFSITSMSWSFWSESRLRWKSRAGVAGPNSPPSLPVSACTKQLRPQHWTLIGTPKI